MPSIKFWATRSISGVGELVRLGGKWCGETYRRLLDNHLKDNATMLIGREWKLQEDNDNVHKCPVVKDWKI